jgi:hypothetical protein
LARTVFQLVKEDEEMKKLVAISAVLLLAAPAMAADWSFYGSQRVATFYVANDYGDGTAVDRFGVGTAGSGEDDDWGLQWNFQSNSRLGARVKADKVTGHIELALKGTDGGDLDVGTRRAYGVWKFTDNASLKVGKDYSAAERFISSQVFNGDDGLEGSGEFYTRRPGQLGLTVGDFNLSLITNALNTTQGGIAPAGSDPDWNLPKAEASYLLKFGSFDLRPFGGVQYFKVSEGASVLTDDLDIWSYAIGIDSIINLGALTIGAQVSYGQNWNNANWQNSAVTAPASASASLDGTDDVNDATTWMGELVVGYKLTDTLKFEAGFGYRSDDPDTPGSDADEMWALYGQAVFTLAPGVYLIPEIGYYDLMDNAAGDNEGYTWYAGAKWQIDF